MLTEPSFLSLDEARHRQVLNKFGEPRLWRHFYGVMDASVPGPQGFLLKMPPHNTGKAHYHRIDQFQVFFGSKGAIYERRPLESVMVHYSDAYSTYGPFASGDEELEFFTLRETGDGLVAFMPEYRDGKIRRSGRNIHVALEPGDALPPGVVSTNSVIALDSDGMAVYRLRGGPSATVTGPDGSAGAGQYYCVISGEVVWQDRPLGRQALGWVPRGSGPLTLNAGPDHGFDVLVLQFPYPQTFPPVPDDADHIFPTG